MGNTASAGPPRLGMVALAKQMPLSKHQLLDLMQECIVITCGCHWQSFTIDRQSFRLALLDTVVDDKDADVLDLLFTLWDLRGSDFIEYRDFLVGVSPLACGPRDSLSSTLYYSLKLMDTARTGNITRHNLAKVLKAINATAAYLGDKVLSGREVDEIVDQVFGQTHMASLAKPHADVVTRLVLHPKVHKFVNAKGSSRYRPPTYQQLSNRVPLSSGKKAARNMEQPTITQGGNVALQSVRSSGKLYEI